MNQPYNESIQTNLNKANTLINKALKENPINITTLNFALGYLQNIIIENTPKDNVSANIKEQDIIIKSKKSNKDKGLGDTSEEHY